MNTTSAFRVVLSVFLIIIWNIVLVVAMMEIVADWLAAEWGDNAGSVTPYVSSWLSAFQNGYW